MTPVDGSCKCTGPARHVGSPWSNPHWVVAEMEVEYNPCKKKKRSIQNLIASCPEE